MDDDHFHKKEEENNISKCHQMKEKKNHDQWNRDPNVMKKLVNDTKEKQDYYIRHGQENNNYLEEKNQHNCQNYAYYHVVKLLLLYRRVFHRCVPFSTIRLNSAHNQTIIDYGDHYLDRKNDKLENLDVAKKDEDDMIRFFDILLEKINGI